MNSDNLDQLSLLLTKQLTITEKKKDGIYFTPSKYALELFNKSKEFKTFTNILEPSCGSGEFLKILPYNNRKIKITGIEYNDTIYKKIKDKYKNVIHKNYLDYNIQDEHDLIIGNPPYYMTKYKYESDLLYGRNNMYILFIIHSMKILKTNGIISFIIPINFMNSSYYNKIRKELYQHWTILEFVRYDDNIFKDTKQKVFGLIVQKTNLKDNSHNDRFVFIKEDQYYFVFDKSSLPTQHYKTLNDLDCKIGVGSIVWKQANRSMFSSTGNTIMIYSSTITPNMDKDYCGDKKKQYRYLKDDSLALSKPCLVLNRGYGNCDYTMKVGLLQGDYKYQLENHVLYIEHNQNNIDTLRQIQSALNDHRTKEFIDTLFGNNAINCFELKKILPIYL